MEKQIPFLFDSVVISSPLEKISETIPNVGRAKVKVFTRFANRNGSYITESVAEQLIDTAPNCPVVGFFDPQTGDWAGHVGPTLASAYGYVEEFLGWEPSVDSDGIEREYAIFSVVLFSDYFQEANSIVGKSQSMELDVNSIDGQWATIEDTEYYIYTRAKMRGFCILGDSVEPCFSSSAFFSKEDETKTQFEAFSKLLFELREKVEKAEEGGTTMEDILNNIEEPVVEAVENFEENAAPVVEEVATPVVEEEQAAEFEAEEPIVEEPVVEEAHEVFEEQPEVDEFAALQERYNELETSFNALQEQYKALVESNNEVTANYEALQNNVDALNEQLNNANARIAEYEAHEVEIEVENKNNLISSYSNLISEEEIKPYIDNIENYSYDELERNLAVVFARKNITEKQTLRAPIVEREESDFAKLMNKYRR